MSPALWQDQADRGFGSDPPNVAIEAQKSADGSSPLQIVLATMSDVRLEGSLTSGEIDIVATMVLLPRVQPTQSGQTVRLLPMCQ
jgi:hypothetical protein